ncbi:MAG: hypothetical protein WC915_01495 [archaeon]
MTREQINICYSLTSQSYDFIPSCETENSCYLKIDELFKTNLGYEQENNLYLLKNNFARSWFYYNKGIKEIKNISNACKVGDAGGLPGPINQAKFYLSESFKEMEEGIKQSINLISVEEELLTKEKIDLLKEEELFYSLIKIRQSINDLENENTNSDNYISFYLKKVLEYNNSEAIKTGNLIEKDSVLMKTYSFSKQLAEDKLKTIELPVLSTYFIKSLPFVENWFYLSESLSELKRLPAKKFMILYSNISGNNNSVLKYFADLVNQTSSNYTQVKNIIPKYWQQIDILTRECEILVDKLNAQKDFDIIKLKLLPKTIQTPTNSLSEFNELILNIQTLKQNSAKGLALGDELSKLKNIKNDLEILKQTLNQKTVIEIDLMIEQCAIRANEIKKSIINTDNLTLQSTQNELIYVSSLVTKNKENLEYCEKMLYLQEDLQNGLSDFEKLKSQKVSLTQDCFAEIKTLLNYYSAPELSLTFNKLQEENVTEENLFYFNDSCNSIKNQLNTLLEDDVEINEIVSNYDSLLDLKQKFIQLKIYNADTKIDTQIKNIDIFLEKQKKYFGPKINYSSVLPVKKELLNTLKNNFNSFAHDYHLLLESTIKIMIKFEIINQQIIKTGEENELLLRVNLQNPFEDINNIFLINANLAGANLISQPFFVKDVFYGENGQIVLSSVPKGNYQIDFKIIKKFSFSEEEKVVYATTKESLVIKTIKLDNQEKVNKLLIETFCFGSTVTVFIDKKEIDYTLINNKISFVVDNASKTNEIEILIYLNNKLTLTKTLKEVQDISLTKQKIVYLIESQNLFETKVNGTIIIPFITNEEIDQVNIYDEIKINKQKDIIDDYIVLKNQEFLAKQTRKYELIVQTSNLANYYYQQLTTIQSKLKYYSLTPQKDIEKLLTLKITPTTIKEIENFIALSTKQIETKEKELEINLNNEILEGIIKDKLIQLKEQAEDAKRLGLIQTQTEINSIIDQANKLINSKDLQKANLLFSKIDFNIDSEIIKEIQSIRKKLSTNSNEELNYLTNEINQKISDLEKIIGFNPVIAQDLFTQIKYLENTFYEKENELNLQKNEISQNNILLIDELYNANFKLITSLEKEIDFDPDELLKIKFILPITNQRLITLKQKNENEYLKNTEQSLVELKKINYELIMAQDEIKKETIKKFNLAIDSGVANDVLAQSKELIDSNDYISAMFALNQQAQPNFLWFIPIVLIVIVAVVLKLNFKNKKSNKDTLQKQVLESWEE